MSSFRIAVDAMGGDFAPAAAIEGAAAAAREYQIPVTLVGPEAIVRAELDRLGLHPLGLEIVHAPDVIAMHEHVTASVRHQRNSSIAVGMRLIKECKASAFVSAGNSAAVMAMATLSLGRLPGVERPALGTVFPMEQGRFLLLDVGANADSRPEFLVQWAQLGKIYAERVLRIANPRIGLLNIGEEPGKGSDFARDVFDRLSGLPELNFVGNIEGKDLTLGHADVVVTDGFTGNVTIKTAEGAAEFILKELRGALTSRLHYKLAALVLRPALMKLRSRIDYAEYGGAPLLGVNGIVLMSHGRSNARAISVAVRVASETAKAGMVESTAAALQSSARAAGSGDVS